MTPHPPEKNNLTLRYDTIEEFNVDSKAEYSALSSTRSQKKKLKQTTLLTKDKKLNNLSQAVKFQYIMHSKTCHACLQQLSDR